MEQFKNLDRALEQIKTKKAVDPELEITDGEGKRVLNPTKEDLNVLKRERNRAEYAAERKAKEGKQNSEIATQNFYQNGGIIEDAFNPLSWVDNKGNFKGIPVYDTPEELVGKIMEWENLMLGKMKSGSDVIPNAELLTMYLGVSPGTIKAWRRGERGEAFKNVIEIELNKIAVVENQLAMKGAIPQVVWATIMNNQHGYTQNSKMEIDVTAKRTPESSETLIKSAKLLP